MTSPKQHLEYFHFRCKIQFDLPVDGSYWPPRLSWTLESLAGSWSTVLLSFSSSSRRSCAVLSYFPTFQRELICVFPSRAASVVQSQIDWQKKLYSYQIDLMTRDVAREEVCYRMRYNINVAFMPDGRGRMGHYSRNRI